MVALLIFARMQSGAPLVAELTVLAQFVIFLSLPSEKQAVRVPASKEPLREALRRS
jgi:hypothetical protein